MVFISCAVFPLFLIVTIMKQTSFFPFEERGTESDGYFMKEKQQQLIPSIKACHVTAEPWHHQQQTTSVPKTARCIREIKPGFLHAGVPTLTDEKQVQMPPEYRGWSEGRRDKGQ